MVDCFDLQGLQTTKRLIYKLERKFWPPLPIAENVMGRYDLVSKTEVKKRLRETHG